MELKYTPRLSEANGGAHKIYNATVHCLIAKRAGKKYVGTWCRLCRKDAFDGNKKFGLKCKIFMGLKISKDSSLMSWL